ncbi:hypothetical protein ACSBR2_020025 [Camellia fascicularis]
MGHLLNCNPIQKTAWIFPIQRPSWRQHRNFSCLTTGDSIMVAYNNKKCYIDIIETKPSNAISIIETDCEVDFAPPLDYKEPEKLVATVPSSKALTKVPQAK